MKNVKFQLSGLLGIISTFFALCVIGRYEGGESVAVLAWLIPCACGIAASYKLAKKYDDGMGE